MVHTEILASSSSEKVKFRFSSPSETKCNVVLRFSCAHEHACLCHTAGLMYSHISFPCPDSPPFQGL